MKKRLQAALMLLAFVCSLPGAALALDFDSEDALKNILSAMSGRDDCEKFFYNDYDGDGLYEAFACMGNSDGTTDIWFVNPLLAKTVMTGITLTNMLSMTANGETQITVIEETENGSVSHTLHLESSLPVIVSEPQAQGFDVHSVTARKNDSIGNADAFRIRPTAKPANTAQPIQFFIATPEPTAVPAQTTIPIFVPPVASIVVPTAQPTPTAAPTAEPAAPSAGQNTTVALYDTPIYFGPGTNFGILTQAPAGSTLEYMGFSVPDAYGIVWYGISYQNDTGWVSSDYIGMQQDTPPVQPVVEKPAVTIADNSISRYTGSFDVSASSYRTSNTLPVRGYCAADGDLSTAWNTNQQLVGEWLQIKTANGAKYQVAGVRIAPGYWKNNDVFNNNSKPRTIDVYADSVYVDTLYLENSKSYQTFWFDAPVTAGTFRFVITDGYYGYKYTDCCITEAELLGPAGRTLHSAAIADWGAAVQKAAARVNSGNTIRQGDYGVFVVGLQILLRDGFGVLSGTVDGSFGNGTRTAVETLAAQMYANLPYCEPMTAGVVNGAYWRNMLAYMDMR